MKKWISAMMFCAAVAFLLQGCASVPRAAATKEGLMRAAEDYWKLRIEDKYGETYKLEDKDGLPPFEKYQHKASLIKKFKIVSHSVGEAEVEDNKGTVKVNVSFMLPNIPKPMSDSIRDEWIFKSGEWLHIFPTK